MTIYCLPLISPGDYETFRRLLNNDLPDTYNEWSNLHLKKLSDVRRQGESLPGNQSRAGRVCAVRGGEQVHAQL